MSSRVFSDTSAQQVAIEYLTERDDALDVGKVSTLRLESGWLVEVTLNQPNEESPNGRALLMINRHGFVEEMGTGPESRRTAAGCLAGMRRAAETVDLRYQ